MKGKIFNAQDLEQVENIKKSFESDFRVDLFNHLKKDERELTFGIKISDRQMTIEELNKRIENSFDYAISKNPNVIFFFAIFLFSWLNSFYILSSDRWRNQNQENIKQSIIRKSYIYCLRFFNTNFDRDL